MESKQVTRDCCEKRRWWNGIEKFQGLQWDISKGSNVIWQNRTTNGSTVIDKRVPEKANIIEKRGRGSNGRIHCCGQQDRKR